MGVGCVWRGLTPPPRTVTYELSRVTCCWRRCQDNRQHMQVTREKETPVKSREWPWVPSCKQICLEVDSAQGLFVGEGGNRIHKFGTRTESDHGQKRGQRPSRQPVPQMRYAVGSSTATADASPPPPPLPLQCIPDSHGRLLMRD